jgi:branched-chain amino acid transport system ATP-binding protein
MMFGRQTGAASLAQAHAPEVALETRALCKSFAGYVVVDSVDLKVRRGAIHGIIGPNGAGKTTLFNLITRFLPPSSGAILYRGRDITRSTPAKVARQGLVRSFQISSVFPSLSVRHNICLALQRKLSTSMRFWRSEACLKPLDEKAERLAHAVGLKDHLDHRTAELPYGRKRAVELATTIALEPDLLLLDEPTAGMGHEDIDIITGLIRSVAANRTVLLVEHNIKVISTLCQTISVMERGRLIAEGSYEEVSQNAAVKLAYLGTAHA